MNPLYQEITAVLRKQSFEIDINESIEIEIDHNEKGKISTHCMNTLKQLMFLIHGARDGKKLLTKVYLTKNTLVFCSDLESGILIEIGAIFWDTFKGETSAKSLLELDITPEVKDFNSRLYKLFKQQMRIASKTSSRIDPKINGLLMFSRCMRTKQFQVLKSSVMSNETRLSKKIAYMYYIVIRFDPIETRYRGHAFALEQRINGSERAEYALWHSWYNKFTLLEDRGYQVLFKRSIETFLNDLTHIFSGLKWDAHSEKLWEKWFSIPVFDTTNEPLDLIRFHPESKTDPSITLESTTMCFSVAPYNPRSIHHTVQQHLKELNTFAEKG